MKRAIVNRFSSVLAPVTLAATVTSVVFVAPLGHSRASALGIQEPADPKKLFEAGQWDQTVSAVSAQGDHPSPEWSYLAGQSYLRMEQADGARAQFAKLSAGVPEESPTAWSLIGQSATALIEGNRPLGIEAARRAVDLASDQFHPHYQLGLALAAAQQWEQAAEAFDKATTIDQGFAYAHYYAGLAYSNIKQVSRMASHFDQFLKLAPDAPERTAVTTLMKRVR